MVSTTVALDGVRRRKELALNICRHELDMLGFSNEEIEGKLDDHIYEVAEYTGESLVDVATKINHSVDDGTILWNELKPEGEERLLQFHSKTRRKIYSMTGICDYLAVIREKALNRIKERGKLASLLDFGGSHGHFSIGAAEAGLDVTYADIGLEVRKFARWRVARRNLKVAFADIEDNRCVFTNKTYDYIVCLDVASHLPNLRQYLRDFWSCLKDDGELFFGDDLFDFLVPWHLNENKIYCDLNKKKELFTDFKEIEQLWANCTIYRKR